MIRAMDYKRHLLKADPSHPSDLIPAASTICERDGLSGRDLILGSCWPTEIEMRLSSLRSGNRERGWHQRP